MKISYVRKGKYEGSITDPPDYELQAYLGPNLGIFEPRDTIYLSYLVDELGLDGINAGNVLGFTAELYQRGILSKEELDGLDLQWGNTDAFGALLHKIANREGIGSILAEGTYRAAIKLGKNKNMDLLKYAVQVKGIGVGAHGIRSGLDYTIHVSYAVSVHGGDHTSVGQLPVKQARGEISSVFRDSAVICSFTSGSSVEFEKLMEFVNAVTGWNYTEEKWINEYAIRIIHLQRILLLLGGPDIYWDPRVHDDNPPRFYEPLPTGFKKGSAPTREDVKKAIKQYYEEIGYDENGIPREDILKALDLEDAIPLVKKIKNRLNI